MMAGTIISGVIFCIVAMIMLGIGVSQLKSKEPVGFYTGENPPKVDQLSDVNSWNKKHGVMWIIYGICIIGSWICSAFIGGDSIYSVIPLCILQFIRLKNFRGFYELFCRGIAGKREEHTC